MVSDLIRAFVSHGFFFVVFAVFLVLFSLVYIHRTLTKAYCIIDYKLRPYRIRYVSYSYRLSYIPNALFLEYIWFCNERIKWWKQLIDKIVCCSVFPIFNASIFKSHIRKQLFFLFSLLIFIITFSNIFANPSILMFGGLHMTHIRILFLLSICNSIQTDSNISSLKMVRSSLILKLRILAIYNIPTPPPVLCFLFLVILFYFIFKNCESLCHRFGDICQLARFQLILWLRISCSEFR